MFTFVVISYNQEHLVIETLESIKYQIETYGNGREYQIIIADDGSADKTYLIEKRWLEKNMSLFHDVVVLPSDVNQGTARNFTRTFPYIKGQYVKYIAGDDLIADTDFTQITDLLERENADVCIAMVLRFDDNNNKADVESMECFNRYIRFSKSAIKWLSKYKVTYYPVCWILKKDLLDEGAKEEVDRCGLIDDWPLWRHINQAHDLRYAFVEEPILLYRRGHNSISTPNSEYASQFHSDYKEICKRYSVGENLLGKYILHLNKALNVPRLGFHKYFDPTRYYMKLHYILDHREGDRVEKLLQENHIKRNQKLLRKIVKDAEFIHEDLIEQTC